MNSLADNTALAAAADFIVRDFMCVAAKEQVVITADNATDPRGIDAIRNAVRVAGARMAVLTMQQLPHQGGLSDPYIPEPVVAAVKSCDVWFEMTFPYMSGSKAHAEAMKGGRVRSLNLLDLGAGGIARLFGQVNFDRLFALQDALDQLISANVGKQCRIANEKGTDITFMIAKPATRKLRKVNKPGTYTPPGSAVIYPEPETAKGTVVIEATFHEFHTLLKTPMRLEVNGRIQKIDGGSSDVKVLDRALRRAAGGEYGSVIHFSHGFHPAARFTGNSFNEDIRVIGNDAVGFGIPWWQPGGGENHPDGVVTMHSIWIDGKQIVDKGDVVASPELMKLEKELHAG